MTDVETTWRHRDPLDLESLTADEIRLYIREAAKVGMKVEGHVQTLQGARNAIVAGIWSIAHSTGLNEEMHTLMAQKGIWRAGTDTPDGLAGHPVSPQAYQRTINSLKDAYAKKAARDTKRKARHTRNNVKRDLGVK